MFSKGFSIKTTLAFLIIVSLLPVFGDEIPVVDTSRINQFRNNLKKIISDIRWAIGIYDDAKGSYQQLDKLLGDVYHGINSLIEGEALEILTGVLTGDFKEILLSGDYFKRYITGNFEKLLTQAISIDEFFGDSIEDLSRNNLYMQNPKVKARFEEIRKVKNELKNSIGEALEILTQVQNFQESIEKDSELETIEQIVGQYGRLSKTSSEMTNTDSLWAIYAVSEFKRMVKLFGTYAILEQARKESIHKEILKARGYSFQLEE